MSNPSDLSKLFDNWANYSQIYDPYLRQVLLEISMRLEALEKETPPSAPQQPKRFWVRKGIISGEEKLVGPREAEALKQHFSGTFEVTGPYVLEGT